MGEKFDREVAPDIFGARNNGERRVNPALINLVNLGSLDMCSDVRRRVEGLLELTDDQLIHRFLYSFNDSYIENSTPAYTAGWLRDELKLVLGRI